MICILPAQGHTLTYSGNKQGPGNTPRPLFFIPLQPGNLGNLLASLEYPQYPHHVLQLAALVLILILGELPQIAPICSLVHIPRPVWYPAAKTESVYEEGRRLQVLVRQGTAFVIPVQRPGAGFLLAPVVQLGAFAAQEHGPGQVQIPHPLPTGRAEEKGLTAAESVSFAG